MNVSRKWLNEFVDLPLNIAGDREFAERMTVSGSKVEVTEDLSKTIQRVVAARVVEMQKHPDSDHMFVLQLDVGAEKLVQIVSGAWNLHVGDLVPAALDGSLLPNGTEIHKGMLRGVESDGMLCSLKELELTTHDYAYAEIVPAAILNDYHPLDRARPSIPADIKAGDKVYGPVKAAEILSVKRKEYGCWMVKLSLGSSETEIMSPYSNLHAGDLVAFDTKRDAICTLSDLHAEQAEFPHCITDGIFIINEKEAPASIQEPERKLQPGDEVGPFIGRDDHVVEFEITPNRPDCLCMIGMAREAAATFDKELRIHEPVVRAEAGGNVHEMAKIIIEEPELCYRYNGRMVKNVKIGPSPAWMRERIRNAGMRPINNLVDITNYVMLEYGQPMHAFDFSCVKDGEVHVRLAREGETIQTLDGTERTLSTSMLCICDTEKPVGVAGVMGGANSEIVGDTAMVLFESANFNGASVRRTATALGMRTDASSRYEKGLDPENTLRAVNRACELVELLGAGEVVDGIIDEYPAGKKETTVLLEPKKINDLLGTEIDRDTMAAILVKLGFVMEGDVIHVPSWRMDVEHYSDIAEEVARFYGYNEIPIRFTAPSTLCGGFTPEQQCERRIGEICRSLGMDEIITYSFISPTYYDKIRLPEDSPLRDSLKILNPLGEDTSIMRTTILPSMLEILTRNYKYRNRQAFLYEIGRTYRKREDGLADESRIVSLGAYGPKMSFFALKGWVDTLLKTLGIEKVRYVQERENPSYHPGRCSTVWAGDVCLGTMGQIHPEVAKNYTVDAELYCAQLSFSELFRLQGGVPVFHPLPRFPSVNRDIAVVCDVSIPAGVLKDFILENGGVYLKDCTIFDVYTGHHIMEGKKSVAFSLTMRADDQTLTDEHAEETVKRILKALYENYGAEIR